MTLKQKQAGLATFGSCLRSRQGTEHFSGISEVLDTEIKPAGGRAASLSSRPPAVETQRVATEGGTGGIGANLRLAG